MKREKTFGDVILGDKGKRGVRMNSQIPGLHRWMDGCWYQCLEHGTSDIDMENIYESVATGMC